MSTTDKVEKAFNDTFDNAKQLAIKKTEESAFGLSVGQLVLSVAYYYGKTSPTFLVGTQAAPTKDTTNTTEIKLSSKIKSASWHFLGWFAKFLCAVIYLGIFVAIGGLSIYSSKEDAKSKDARTQLKVCFSIISAFIALSLFVIVIISRSTMKSESPAAWFLIYLSFALVGTTAVMNFYDRDNYVFSTLNMDS